jgi:hypothetical protein
MTYMEVEESLIVRCKKLSPAANEYMENMMYLGDVEDSAEVTQAFLTQKAVSIIMAEVADIGIVSEFDIEDFVTDTANFEAMFAMRERLNNETLYEYFKSMTMEQWTVCCNILDDTQRDDDLLLNLIHYMAEISPLDLKIGQILQCSNHWVSNFRFRQHLDALRRKMDNTDMNKTNVNDDNILEITEFLKLIQSRTEAVVKAVQYLLGIYTDLNEEYMLQQAMKYDHDKLDPDKVHIFAKYNRSKESFDGEPQCVSDHHRNVDHHIQYWMNRKKKDQVISATREHCVFIMLSIRLDDLDISQAKAEIDKYKQMFPNNLVEFMYEILNKHYDQLRGVMSCAYAV